MIFFNYGLLYLQNMPKLTVLSFPSHKINGGHMKSKWRKNPLKCPTQAVGWYEHAADAAHPLASVRHRS
jgi:hypothetical protein